MRRPFEHGTKVRLSFSGGPHAPLNMAWRMPVVRPFLDPKKRWSPKDLRKLGVRNIAQCSAPNVPFSACFSSDIYFFHTIRDVYRNVLPARGAKPRFECSKRMIVKVASRFSPLSGKWFPNRPSSPRPRFCAVQPQVPVVADLSHGQHLNTEQYVQERKEQ